MTISIRNPQVEKEVEKVQRKLQRSWFKGKGRVVSKTAAAEYMIMEQAKSRKASA